MKLTRNPLRICTYSQKNSDRLRARWFQHATIQEFREALISHAGFRYPKMLFQKHEGSKVSWREHTKGVHVDKFVSVVVLCFLLPWTLDFNRIGYDEKCTFTPAWFTRTNVCC